MLGRVRRDRAVVEQLREPDDRVERRAQLVRHVREELALEPVGLRDPPVLHLELDRALANLLELAPLAQVDDRGADQAAVTGEPHEVELRRNELAGSVDEQPFERRDVGAGREPITELARDDGRCAAVRLLGCGHRGEREVAQLARRQPEQPLGRAVGVEDAASLEIVGDERFGRELERRAVALFARPQLALGGDPCAAFGRFAQRALDRRNEAHRPILRQEVERARVQCGNSVRFVRSSRDHDARQIVCAALLDRLQPAEAGNHPVRDHQIPRLRKCCRKLGRVCGASGLYLVAAAPDLAQQDPIIVIRVLDDEQLKGFRRVAQSTTCPIARLSQQYLMLS